MLDIIQAWVHVQSYLGQPYRWNLNRKNTLTPPKHTGTAKEAPRHQYSRSICRPPIHLVCLHLGEVGFVPHRTLHLGHRHGLLRRLHLLKHVLGIEPRLETRDLELVVHLGDSYALNVEPLVVCLDCHGISVLVLADIVALHPAPMTPLADDSRWTTVYLENLPGKVRHHVPKRLVAVVELGKLRPVIFIRGYHGAVGATGVEYSISSVAYKWPRCTDAPLWPQPCRHGQHDFLGPGTKVGDGGETTYTFSMCCAS